MTANPTRAPLPPAETHVLVADVADDVAVLHVAGKTVRLRPGEILTLGRDGGQVPASAPQSAARAQPPPATVSGAHSARDRLRAAIAELTTAPPSP